MNDAWDLLELSKGSPLQQIIKAYRKLSMKLHPDRGGDEAAFKQMKAAYEWLLDNYDTDSEPEVVYKSSLDDEPERGPTFRNPPQRPTGSNFDGYNQWESKETIEINEAFTNSNSNFGGFSANGVATYKFTLGQLLRGDKVKIKLPNYAEGTYQLSKGTRPGAMIYPELEGTASWLRGKRQVPVVVQLIPHQLYTVNKLDISTVVKMSLTDALARKPIDLEHPFLLSELTGSPQRLQLPLGNVIGMMPIVYKNFGFTEGRNTGDLWIYVVIELPKNVTNDKLEAIERILNS